MPVLLLQGHGLVKTVRFRARHYIGDALNTARIFNQLEVDELVVFDIGATADCTGIQFPLLENLASECFMPITYGGGVQTLEEFRRLYFLGFEKVSISSLLFTAPATVERAVSEFGAESVVATLDVRRQRFRSTPRVFVSNGRTVVSGDLLQIVDMVASLGVGEIIVNDSIARALGGVRLSDSCAGSRRGRRACCRDG